MRLRHRESFLSPILLASSGSVDGRISQGEILWRVVLVQGGPSSSEPVLQPLEGRPERLVEQHPQRLCLVTLRLLFLYVESAHIIQTSRRNRGEGHTLSCAAVIINHTYSCNWFLTGHLDITEFPTRVSLLRIHLIHSVWVFKVAINTQEDFYVQDNFL